MEVNAKIVSLLRWLRDLGDIYTLVAGTYSRGYGDLLPKYRLSW